MPAWDEGFGCGLVVCGMGHGERPMLHAGDCSRSWGSRTAAAFSSLHRPRPPSPPPPPPPPLARTKPSRACAVKTMAKLIDAMHATDARLQQILKPIRTAMMAALASDGTGRPTTEDRCPPILFWCSDPNAVTCACLAMSRVITAGNESSLRSFAYLLHFLYMDMYRPKSNEVRAPICP